MRPYESTIHVFTKDGFVLARSSLWFRKVACNSREENAFGRPRIMLYMENWPVLSAPRAQQELDIAFSLRIVTDAPPRIRKALLDIDYQ